VGYYIETSGLKNKAECILKDYAGEELPQPPARYDDIPTGMGLIVVVNNGPFEAAAFCHCPGEFAEFTQDQSDPRPRRYILIDRLVAEYASGFSMIKPGRPLPAWLKEKI